MIDLHDDMAPFDGPTEAEEAARLDRERWIDSEVEKILVREEARRRARKKARPDIAPPPVVPLDEFLAVPDQPQQYRIEGLWPTGGRVMLAAQFKAGKTTLVANLVRALVDGERFLDRFPVDRPTGRVVILDDELDERMIRAWLRDQGIRSADRVAVVPLRGRVSSFDILDPDVRTQWAKALRDADAEIVILDCLAPIVDALGLSEDKEVGRLLVAFDELLGEASVQEAVVVHHMGHSGERTRGASRLRDWPDVEWRLVREKGEDGETDPAAPRFLSAYGRDVDVKESALQFDPATRRLRMGTSSRKDAKYDRALTDITEWLAANPGSSKRQIEAGLLHASEHTRPTLREALKRGVRDGWITAVPGGRGAVLHWAREVPVEEPPVEPTAPPVPDMGVMSAPSHSAESEWSTDTKPSDLHGSSAPSAPREIGLKSDGTNPVRQTERRTQTPQNPRSEGSEDSVRRVRHDRAAQSGTSAPVRPYFVGGAHWRTAPDPNPTTPPGGHPTRTPGGEVIDPDTGEILQPAPSNLVDCAHPGCRNRIDPTAYPDRKCSAHRKRTA